MDKRLEIEGKSFILNGKPIQIISGAMHYFRTLPEQWEDRLLKMKACGLNTVETYMAWNLHEPEPGEYCFTGPADIEAFLTAVDRVGLHAIVRPGPYICSEWDFGGLPYWLLNIKDLTIRCYNTPYLERVDIYFDNIEL